MCSKYGMASSLKPSVRKRSTLSLGKFSTSIRSSVKIWPEKTAVETEDSLRTKRWTGPHLQAVLGTDLQHPGAKLKDDSQVLRSCVWSTDKGDTPLSRPGGGGRDGVAPYPASADTAPFARGPSGESWPWWTDPGAPAELCTLHNNNTKKKLQSRFSVGDESGG